MTYSLQEVTYTDLHDLVAEAIASQAFLPLKADDEPFLEMMPQIFAGEPNFHLFALLENEAQQAGFIATLPHQEENTLSIGPMYIGQSYRGQGLGKRQVQTLIAWAKARGIKRLVTQTWGENTASRHVFEGLGFEFVGEEPNTRVNGDSTVQYLLQLSE